jgi:hypothetical protein
MRYDVHQMDFTIIQIILLINNANNNSQLRYYVLIFTFVLYLTIWLLTQTLLPPRRPEFDPVSGHVRFAADKEALGRIFSECFGSPVHRHFGRTHCLHLQGLMVSQSSNQQRNRRKAELWLFLTHGHTD